MTILRSYNFKKNSLELNGDNVLLRPPQYSDWIDWSKVREVNKLYLQPWEPISYHGELERRSKVKTVRMFEKLSTNHEAYSFLIFKNENTEFI